MLVEIWFICSSQKTVLELKAENTDLADKINLIHRGGHVGFSFDRKPITDPTKIIWGFSPISELENDELFTILVDHYIQHRSGIASSKANTFPGQVLNDYESFKTAIDLGRPIWRWNFTFDEGDTNPQTRLEEMIREPSTIPRYSFKYINCLRFPREIGIPLPAVCSRDLLPFITRIVQSREYNTRCFIKDGDGVKECDEMIGCSGQVIRSRPMPIAPRVAGPMPVAPRGYGRMPVAPRPMGHGMRGRFEGNLDTRKIKVKVLKYK